MSFVPMIKKIAVATLLGVGVVATTAPAQASHDFGYGYSGLHRPMFHRKVFVHRIHRPAFFHHGFHRPILAHRRVFVHRPIVIRRRVIVEPIVVRRKVFVHKPFHAYGYDDDF